MRTKVLTYKQDGNTLTDKFMDLSEIAKGIYISEKDEYETMQVVFEIQGLFFRVDQSKEKLIRENIDYVIKYRENYFDEVLKLNWIQVLHVEIFSRLGKDTEPLLKRRQDVKEKRGQERKEVEQAKIKQRAEAEAQRSVELTNALKELKEGNKINCTDFLELIKLHKIPLHIRTIGMLNDLREVKIGLNQAYVSGSRAKKVNLQKVFEAAKELSLV